VNGKLTQTASGFNSYEIFEGEEDYIFTFADILTKHFGFRTVDTPVAGLEGVYLDVVKNNIKLTVGWDIWSGAFVNAHCSTGNEYVKKIADYCEK
jgi:hypothetical protein